MDGKQKTAAEVEAAIGQLKAEMPRTYKAILEKAKTMDKLAYQLVRRGLRGEPGCFYARERIRKAGQLDRWIVAGCGEGMPDLSPETLCREFNAPDMLELIFVLQDPAVVDKSGLPNAG